MTRAKTAMRAMQPWYSLGLALLVAGLMIDVFAPNWRVGGFAVGNFAGGAMLGLAIVFLIFAIVRQRQWKAQGGAR